jgi:hypothetical protein
MTNLTGRLSTLLADMRTRYWGIPVLLLWGGTLLGLGVIRFDPYGVDETAARALLLIWSVGERIVSTIFVLGLPDFRALLQAPLGAYWPGSMIAAKVYAALVTACAAILLYRWSRQEHGPETALLATGLLLIAPVTVLQIDVLGAGPYLLLAFGVGMWLDRKYRKIQRPLGGWFFLQLIWIIVAVSIHPAALAYPLALVWEWKVNPVDERQQRHVYIGAGVALVFVLAVRLGWPELAWFANPLAELRQAVLGRDPAGETLPLLVAVLLASLLGYLLIAERRAIAEKFMHRMLLLGLVLGAVSADGGWAMLAMAVLLYLGIPHLIRLNERIGANGLAGRRGIVIAAMFVVCLLFMQVIKGHHFMMAQNLLPPVDRLMIAFAAELEDLDPDDSIVTMSQWPGKTMLATRRAALPLPPDYPDSETLLQNIRGVTHLVFDPDDPRNRSLARQLAETTGASETLVLEEGGVAIRIRNDR